MIFPAHPLPVIKARSLELAVGQLETQLSQKDQMTSNCSTEPGNVPGIGRNLGLVKDNIQWRIFMYPHRSSVFEGKFNQMFQ